MATTTTRTINLNILFYDEIKYAEKIAQEALTADPVSHIHLFPYNYTTQEKMFRKKLDLILKEAQDNEVIKAGSPNIIRLETKKGVVVEYSYYTHSATDKEDGRIDGVFLDYHAVIKLISDPRAFSAWLAWVDFVMMDWGKLNGVTWIVDYNKPGEHYRKFHAEIPVIDAAESAYTT